MNRIKKALIYGLSIGLSFNLLGFTVNFLLEGIDVAFKNFKFVGFVSLPLFSFPPFISAFIYHKFMGEITKKTILNTIRLTCAWSFLIQFGIVLFYMKIIRESNAAILIALFNAILAMVVALGSGFVYYLINNKKERFSKGMKFYFSKKHIFFISIVFSSIFSLMTFLFGNNSWGKLLPHLTVLFKSLLVSFIVSEVFQFLFNKRVKRKNFFIVLTYICVVVLFSLNHEVFFYNTGGSITRSVFFAMTIWAPYFLLLCLIVHCYFIYNFNQLDKRYLKQLALESSQKYQNLKSQISPHFLFNNLSVLTGLIEENPKKAVLFSEDLSYIYRHFLEQEQKDLVKLNDALKFAKTYLNLLEHRFENAIEISFSEFKSESFYLIPLALQQVLENIVKHNEISVQHKVKISITLKDDYLIISNSKNTKLNMLHSNKTGLLNIKARYAYFSDKDVVVTDYDDLFTIKLPLLTIEA